MTQAASMSTQRGGAHLGTYRHQPHCDSCSDREAYERVLDSYQRRIDEKREELARLSRGGVLAQQGHVRLAIVQLLRETSPHPMTNGALQVWLWGDESDANRECVKSHIWNIRNTRYGLEPGEEILTAGRFGYKLLKNRADQ